MRKTIFILFLTSLSIGVFGVRPFITDDAAITGKRLFQIQNWTLFDKKNIQNWSMIAYGITDNIELGIGGVFGYSEQKRLSYAIPLIECKILLREYYKDNLPGIAFVAGTFLPHGNGSFTPESHNLYSFLAFTQSFGRDENVLIHTNIGGNYSEINKKTNLILGIGTQIKTFDKLFVVGEITSIDPYVQGTGIAYQVGLRYFINLNIQVDIEIGQGLTNKNNPTWLGFGARFVI